MKHKKLLLLSLLLLFILPLVYAAEPVKAVAKTSSSDAAAGAVLAGGLIIGMMVFFMLIFALILLVSVFWIWMLIDSATRNNYKQENDKVVWILVIVFTHWIGAIIYYFMVKRNLDKGKKKRKK